MTWEHDLEDLPRPEPPPDLAAVVLARIARIDETAPAPSTTPAPSAWPVWVTACGALAAAFAFVSAPAPGADWTWPVVLVVSLVIYVAGLFAPVRN
jgi:hypothetical protein